MSSFDERLDRRIADSRRRIARSPEGLWRALISQMRRITIPPGEPSGPRRRPKSDPNDRLVDLHHLMLARECLICAPTFSLRDYPGLTENAKGSDDDGWIAWFILPDLVTVQRFAEWRSRPSAGDSADRRPNGQTASEATTSGDPVVPPANFKAIERVVDRVRRLAKEFTDRRLAERKDLSFDDRAKVAPLIQAALHHVDHKPDEDSTLPFAFRSRERANELLDIPPAWDIPPAPPSPAPDIVRQLRDQGCSPERILEVLGSYFLANTPEAAELRKEIAATASQSVTPAPVAGAPYITQRWSDLERRFLLAAEDTHSTGLWKRQFTLVREAGRLLLDCLNDGYVACDAAFLEEFRKAVGSQRELVEGVPSHKRFHGSDFTGSLTDPLCRWFNVYADQCLRQLIVGSSLYFSSFDNRQLDEHQTRALLVERMHGYAECCRALAKQVSMRVEVHHRHVEASAGNSHAPSPLYSVASTSNQGWTKSELLAEVKPKLGGTTFDRIREVAGIAAPPLRVKGTRYSKEQVIRMIAAARTAAPQSYKLIVPAWSRLVQASGEFTS